MKDSDPTREPSSRLRQRLRAAYEELGALLPSFFARDPLFRGYVAERAVRCGKPSCRCADGPGHPTWTVTYKEGGRTRGRVLPVGDRERLKSLADTYRHVRTAHRRWRKLVREIEGLLDGLLESRAVHYAPGREKAK
jgi:hypothetical protein